MRTYLGIYTLIILASTCYGQIGNYNKFPSLPPSHLLDNINLLEDISFAYSMRILESDYQGPLVRLRRASDNDEQDFYCNSLDKVNTEAIDTWRNGSTVFMTIWYDQSGQNRNAIQTDPNRQPQFITNSITPYFVGDGVNDSLLVQGSIANVIENGKNATITGVYYASDRADFAFGAVNIANGSDRWITHFNWNNKLAYFDPGYCCNNPRCFRNDFPSSANGPGKLEAWGQYTVLRRDNPTNLSVDVTIMRLDGIQKVSGNFPDNRAFSQTTYPFAIGAFSRNSTGSNTAGHATTRFAEIIAHRKGKSDVFIEEIEDNQIAFWEL